MKVAVFGLGSIGRRHARCFQAAGAKAIVGMDPSEDRRREFAEGLPGAETVADEASALAAAPDLVVVASPNVHHVRQARLAVEAGVPVFVEKPLGVDFAQAEALAALVRERGAYLHMGSNWKFHPAFQAMKRLIDDGAIGRPLSGQVLAGQWLPDWHPWEDYRRMYAARTDLGGGAVFDTHELDYLTWMFGPAARLVGLTGRSGALEIETEDVAAAVILFESGALVTLQTDYLQRVPQRRYLIAGERGTVEWERNGPVVLRRPAAEPETFAAETPDINAMYEAQAARVLDDVRTGAAPLTGVDQALAVLRLQHAWRAGVHGLGAAPEVGA